MYKTNMAWRKVHLAHGGKTVDQDLLRRWGARHMTVQGAGIAGYCHA